MPENTVYVGRPGKWGNPIKVVSDVVNHEFEAGTPEEAVTMFQDILSNPQLVSDYGYPLSDIEQLGGKNLACWCSLDHACHADVLLEIANNE